MIKKINRKSMLIRTSGRSSDYISPSFGYGCLYNCSYCYMKRHKPTGLDVATNTNQILTEIDSHSWFADVEKPNQTHEEYVTYDISCNEDFALHAKHHEWEKIFKFFKEHPKAMGTFATKYVNKKLLDFNPYGKVRIRFSLMPENKRKIVEPKTSSIEERLDAVKLFQDAGYDVHLNFSPVIFYDKWLNDYKDLFIQVRNVALRDNWHAANATYADRPVKAEVIFLTHNRNKHLYNTMNKVAGEDLLWTPQIQESKTSQYGGDNIRYKASIKKSFINDFKDVHDFIIPWNEIRYIF
jgi:spore photoproduct lyase